MNHAARLLRISKLFQSLSVEFQGLVKDSVTPVRPEEANKNIELAQSIHEVLKYYRKIHPGKGRGVKPGHRLWVLLRERVKEGYSADDLKKAIDGNLICDWHKSNPNGHTLEFVFRNSTKVDGFIEKAKKGPTKERANGHHQGSDGFADGDRDFDLG